MNYFYSAGVMGYGEGRFWHKYYNFPDFPRVTKTLTYVSRIGCPFAVVRLGNTIWNKVSLSNMGLGTWAIFRGSNNRKHTTVSIAGPDIDITCMMSLLNKLPFSGIELNFSCPNVKSFKNKEIPASNKPLYLKLNHLQDPYDYDLDKITGVRLNSVPKFFGGISGKMAQKYNWPWIKKFNKEGLDVAGCSCNTMDDIKYMEDIGCKEIGLGSIVLTNPKLIKRLNWIKQRTVQYENLLG
jgi:dihydroorotate dehydrogenase